MHTAKDGSSFYTIKIGSQTWFSQNLNVSTFKNGDAIPYASNKEEWATASNNHSPAWAYNAFDAIKGKKYGKVYNYYTVNDPRGLAPEGYHIPSSAEWNTLIEANGGVQSAGYALRADYCWGLLPEIQNANNKSGFSAMPGQSVSEYGEGMISDAFGVWWSTSKHKDSE
ncbi:MAG: fibrobacter succinogenes major paralogous domain-containing protein [Bacteroidetes bacterium]|nr:fibrobacter succinogenes major paralogous domain-containing protein [Bacteroidota bacterium]